MSQEHHEKVLAQLFGKPAEEVHRRVGSLEFKPESNAEKRAVKREVRAVYEQALAAGQEIDPTALPEEIINQAAATSALY